MSSQLIYFCDVNDCHNNSFQNDDIAFHFSNGLEYELEKVFKFSYESKHICSCCLDTLQKDYPTITLDDISYELWWDYTI